MNMPLTNSQQHDLSVSSDGTSLQRRNFDALTLVEENANYTGEPTATPES